MKNLSRLFITASLAFGLMAQNGSQLVAMAGQQEVATPNQRLLTAVDSNSVDLLNAAIADGANINNARDNRINRTALHIAAFNGNDEIVAILLNAPDVNVPALIQAQDNVGETALHLAAMFGFNNITFELLHLGANGLAVDHNNRTPAWFARQANHHELANEIEDYVRMLKIPTRAPGG